MARDRCLAGRLRRLGMKTEDISLRRRITLPMLVLYGVGVTIGAGIYVLIGAMARHAGMHAPFAFLLAAVVMGLTAASFAELCTRFPVSAGEAAYVRAAFRFRPLTLLVGLLTAAIGVVSSATVALTVSLLSSKTAAPTRTARGDAKVCYWAPSQSRSTQATSISP